MLDLCKLVELLLKTLIHSRMSRALRSNSFDRHLSDWVAKKKKMGASESKLFFPFLVGAPKLKVTEHCRACEGMIYHEEELWSCSMKNCNVSYHLRCASDRFGSSEEIMCPQHECYHCNKKTCLWRCSRCDLASHYKCASYPEYMIRSEERQMEMICWRHSTDSPLKGALPTSSIEEVFSRLPLSYVEKEFKIDPTWRDAKVQPSSPITSIKEVFGRLPLSYVEKEFEIDPMWRETMVDNLEPPSHVQPSFPIFSIEELFRSLQLRLPSVEEEFKIDLTWKDSMGYVHIKRNIYMIKKKSYDVDNNLGDCTCSSPDICYEDCLCRSLFVSCTRACKCSGKCTNRRPFKKKKKIEVVMTQHCGLGVKAVEFINEHDYIIEYVGEVIDDALCEDRFWEMKGKGFTKFYVVQVRTGVNIDAKYKGNESRFINHSCDPNCEMQKWDVNGETRLGIFALKSIEPGEELTFNYGFEKYEREEVKCLCGASSCKGYLGSKLKIRGG